MAALPRWSQATRPAYNVAMGEKSNTSFGRCFNAPSDQAERSESKSRLKNRLLPADYTRTAHTLSSPGANLSFSRLRPTLRPSTRTHTRRERDLNWEARTEIESRQTTFIFQKKRPESFLFQPYPCSLFSTLAKRSAMRCPKEHFDRIYDTRIGDMYGVVLPAGARVLPRAARH